MDENTISLDDLESGLGGVVDANAQTENKLPEPKDVASQEIEAPSADDNIISISDLESAVGGEEKPRITDVFGVGPNTLEGVAVEAFVSPLAELARGYNKASAEMYDLFNGATKLVQFISNNSIDTTSLQKVFSDASDAMEGAAEEIPETSIFANKVYELAGQSPAFTAQLATIPIQGPLSFVAKNAIFQGLNSFDKEQSVSSLVDGIKTGAVEGAMGEAGIKVGIGVLTKGAEILNRFGKNAFKQWIRVTTGDEELAKKFLENPEAYKIKDERSVQKIFEDYNNKKFELSEANKSSQKRIKDKVDGRILDIKEKTQLAQDELKRANDLERISIKDQTKASIDAARESAEKSIDLQKQVIDARINDLYAGAINGISTVEKNIGEQVGQLKKALRAVSPGAFISWETYGKPIEKAIHSLPGMKLVNGKMVPINGTTPLNGLASRVNTILEELSQFRRDGEVPLQFAFEMSQKGFAVDELLSFAKNNELFPTFGDYLKRIKGTTSLDKLKVDGVNLLSKSKEAKSLLDELVKKNREFEITKTKYDNAMKHYATKDVNGRYVPDPSRAIGAIKRNDVQKIKEMELADSVLPKEQRLLPKVRELVNDLDVYEASQKRALDSTISALKKKQDNFMAGLDRAEKELARNSQKMTSEERKKSADILWNIRKAHREGFRKQSIALQDERDRIVGAKMLDSWLAQNYGGLQAGVAVGSAYKKNAAGVLGALLLSPKVASGAAKAAKGASGSLKRFSQETGIGEALKEENAKAIRKLLGIEPK